MTLCIGEVLDAATLARLTAVLDGATFEDGRLTAGWSARLVKHNRQLAADSPAHAEVTRTICEALRSSQTLQAAALPRIYRPPLISRSDAGMGYGLHVDDALMGQPPVRVDLSYTLFLCAPDVYEGGELVLEDAQGEHSFKLQAGAMVLYPATYLHRVETVRSGVRLAAVGWIQKLDIVRTGKSKELIAGQRRVQEKQPRGGGLHSEFGDK